MHLGVSLSIEAACVLGWDANRAWNVIVPERIVACQELSDVLYRLTSRGSSCYWENFVQSLLLECTQLSNGIEFSIAPVWETVFVANGWFECNFWRRLSQVNIDAVPKSKCSQILYESHFTEICNLRAHVLWQYPYFLGILYSSNFFKSRFKMVRKFINFKHQKYGKESMEDSLLVTSWKTPCYQFFSCFSY